jgi:16S rRNA (guanine527-N7)-methyltransferase
MRKNIQVRKNNRYRPSFEGLKNALAKHSIELKQDAMQKLWAYHQLIHKNNEDGDLTRLRSFETMVEKHYADCIITNAFVNEWPNKMLDIGSGAGFPGIPLKIVNPHINLTLCEPRNVRVNFLNHVIEKLDLKDIQVFGHKVTSNSMNTPVKGVITRAFEHYHKTILRINNSLEVGGRAFFMKGPALKEEMLDPIPENYQIVLEKYYTIPASTQERALLILERTA